MITSINDRWKHFEKSVLPKEAPDIQRQEMKRAFFAGFSLCLDIMCIEISELEEDDGVKEIQRLRAQIEGFTEAVRMKVA